MRSKSKKGFTIVELVIVIAVIAILAAVLIPTFSSLIKKANESADLQNTRNMNTVIAANEEKIEEYYQQVIEGEGYSENVDEKEAKAEAVYRVCLEMGYSIGKMNNASSEYTIVYDYGNHSLVLIQLVGEEVRIVSPNNSEVTEDYMGDNYIVFYEGSEDNLWMDDDFPWKTISCYSVYCIADSAASEA